MTTDVTHSDCAAAPGAGAAARTPLSPTSESSDASRGPQAGAGADAVSLVVPLCPACGLTEWSRVTATGVWRCDECGRPAPSDAIPALDALIAGRRSQSATPAPSVPAAPGDAARMGEERVRDALRELRATVDDTTAAAGETAPLRNALIGFRSDATFYSQWERNRAALVRVLDALDAEMPRSALAPPAPSVPAAPTDGVREMARRLPDSFIAEMRERRDLSRAICELVTLRNAILTAPVPAAPGGARIYVASKTRHAARWLAMRAAGVPIVSTWIDEAGPGATSDWGDLWDRCVSESASASALVLYAEPGDVLRGGFVELGAALARGVPVFYVGPDDVLGNSLPHFPRITRCASLDEAFARAALAPSAGGDQ